MAQKSQKEKTHIVWHMAVKDKKMYEPKEISIECEALQELVGGTFDIIEIGCKKGVEYAIVYNENGINLDLPVNTKVQKFVPILKEIRGDVVFIAHKQTNGADVDMGEIGFNEMKKMANTYLEKEMVAQMKRLEQYRKAGVPVFLH